MDKSIGNRVFRGTVIIVLIGIFAKIAAFLSEAILAAYLGTTYQSDAYYMVSSIKDVIYPMLCVGIWKVFLPVYKEKLTKNNIREARVCFKMHNGPDYARSIRMQARWKHAGTVPTALR